MFNLIVGALNDVIIIGGTAMVTAMMATGTAEIPSPAVCLLSLLMGLIQAARRWDSKTAPSPIKEEAVVVRTPAQLEKQAKVTEDTIAHAVERVTAALKTPPVVLAEVTPQRVEEPVSTQKDSS